jgi:hypothetical protein
LGLRFLLAGLACAAVAALALPLPSAAGNELVGLKGESYGTLDRRLDGGRSLLFFLSTDCPIANQYAPEIRRICAEYGPAGIQCYLVYVDPSAAPDTLLSHRRDFGQEALRAIHDRQHRLVRRAGVTVSSEAALFSGSGKLEYRGRIDNLHAGIGMRRYEASRRDLREALDAVIAGRPVPQPRTEAVGCFIPEISTEERP